MAWLVILMEEIRLHQVDVQAYSLFYKVVVEKTHQWVTIVPF